MSKKELENKIKELENELNKLKEELQSISNKRRKPKEDVTYWCIAEDNRIYTSRWDDDSTDNARYNNYNCFLTKEEAERAQRVRETENLLRRYVEEHDAVKLDWTDTKQPKYYMYYYFDGKRILYDSYCYTTFARTIYASSEQILKDAVKEIGEDRIAEYLTY